MQEDQKIRQWKVPSALLIVDGIDENNFFSNIVNPCPVFEDHSRFQA